VQNDPQLKLGPMPRRRLYRVVFTLAGLYNLSWGLFTIIDPQAVFRFAGMEPINHPAFVQCLGMVIGLYGIGYLEVARFPEDGFALAGIGLAGKVFGPFGALVLILRPENPWPWQFGALNLCNDLIWWVPFAFYMRDAWPFWRARRPAAVTENS
jgi:hypothetical protein